MSDSKISPKHYSKLKPQPIEVVEAWELDHHRASALAYLARAGSKPGESYESDIRKAIWFLERSIQHRRNKLLLDDELEQAWQDMQNSSPPPEMQTEGVEGPIEPSTGSVEKVPTLEELEAEEQRAWEVWVQSRKKKHELYPNHQEIQKYMWTVSWKIGSMEQKQEPEAVKFEEHDGKIRSNRPLFPSYIGSAGGSGSESEGSGVVAGAG